MSQVDLRHNTSHSRTIYYPEGKFGKALAKADTGSGFVGLREVTNYDLVLGSEFCLSFLVDQELLITFENTTDFDVFNLNVIVNLNNATNNSEINLNSDVLILDENLNFVQEESENIYTGAAIADGTLHHILIQREYNGLTATSRFFLDGQEVYTADDTDEPMVGRTEIAEQLYVFFEGAIDHLQIFHRSLSEAEIAKVLEIHL